MTAMFSTWLDTLATVSIALGSACAMLAGFATASPVNWLLIHIGRKEKM